MGVTIKDVAEAAGVSISTVSKVLNGHYSISEKTAERVRGIMREMNYYPNANAQSFASGSNHTVVLLANLAPNAAFQNPHMFEIIAGLEEALCKRGYRLILRGADATSACGIAEEIISRRSADAIAVHARTKTMLYSGRADWDRIREVCACVHIPVVANGDIDSPEAALRCRAHSGAQLCMVGRAAFGDPWLLGQIAAALCGQEIPARPALSERMDLALHQIELAADDKGEHIACLEARKHLSWYLRGVAHSSFYKDQISRLSTLEEVYAVVKAIKRDLR